MRAYFLVTTKDHLKQREFIRAVREMEDTPGVNFVDPVIGSRDMVIMVDAPITVEALAKEIEAKPWIKDMEVLRIVSIFKQHKTTRIPLAKGQLVSHRYRKEKMMMKAYFMFTDAGPRVILTSYDLINNPESRKMLRSKGFTKFIAHEVPVESAKAKYGMHFDVVCNDPHESDDLRILDYKPERAYKLFSFKELGPPIYYESSPDGGGYLWLYPRLSPSFLSANL